MTAVAPAGLTVQAPSGSHFEWEQVSNKQGQDFDVPILVWDDRAKYVEYYGDEGVLAIADGTSLRVSFQNIARRGKQAKEPATDDAIAQDQVDFRPGSRKVGESTPQSRAGRAAKKAVEANPAIADQLAALLDRVATGQLSDEEKLALGLVG